MKKVLGHMADHARAMASKAAKEAAKRITSKVQSARAAEARRHSATIERKMKLLRKDATLLETAMREAKREAAAAKLKAEHKAAHYKASVNAKVVRAKKDFDVMKKKLAAYKGTKRSEKKAADHLRTLAQQVV